MDAAEGDADEQKRLLSQVVQTQGKEHQLRTRGKRAK